MWYIAGVNNKPGIIMWYIAGVNNKPGIIMWYIAGVNKDSKRIILWFPQLAYCWLHKCLGSFRGICRLRPINILQFMCNRCFVRTPGPHRCSVSCLIRTLGRVSINLSVERWLSLFIIYTHDHTWTNFNLIQTRHNLIKCWYHTYPEKTFQFIGLVFNTTNIKF